ncbi:alpha/beta hydrolase [Limnoglobus roseus]|uniref:Alpha/beta hydrolase n=1 Tax=Limnoglobus roseus TaxID=2598579 RepID=A0A5C1APH6_9BACT|nr:alpha/beta hydrolase [Limnoglobus roseus]QEL20057.1 alpha/beta hydrolase [Limnoglobus roseus]
MRSLVLLLLFASASLADDPKPTVTLDLWPGKAPGETKDLPPEALNVPKAGQIEVKRLGNVSKPQISVYQPENPNGACVVIAPGGGYSILAIEHEGTDVAKWLNSLKVTAVVLKYRVPKREKQSPDNLAMQQDAQRAVGLVRSKAKEWKLDPAKIGMLGFSAGGHLTACLCTNNEKRLYDKVDDADAVSCRPDFAVLVYPAYLVKKDTTDVTDQLPVTKQTPPTFFAHASDDPVSCENSIGFYRALKKNGVPAEMHLFAKGGHGFGMQPNRGPASDWPKLCGDWMKATGIVK